MKGYFDYNATTPLHPAAEEAWLRAQRDHWYNASSLYREAGFTAQKLDAARERLAGLLGMQDGGRILFTSGATEANNALLGHLYRGKKVAVSAIEHPSVTMSVHDPLLLAVNENGVVSAESLKQCVKETQPDLISLMAANNESGALQCWYELVDLCADSPTRCHTDASQWLGKLYPPNLANCHYVTGSGHKFGGPKGVGFLVMADEKEALGFLRGGPQESGRRAGTENYPAIEAMVTALEQIEVEDIMHRQELHRDAFEQRMKAAFPELRIISEKADRLWNTSLMVMPQHSNLKWLTRLSRLGFAISTGSACSSGKEGSSTVVTALGASADELRRVVRVSGGWETTEAEWLDLAVAFSQVRDELGKIA